MGAKRDLALSLAGAGYIEDAQFEYGVVLEMEPYSRFRIRDVVYLKLLARHSTKYKQELNELIDWIEDQIDI